MVACNKAQTFVRDEPCCCRTSWSKVVMDAGSSNRFSARGLVWNEATPRVSSAVVLDKGVRMRPLLFCASVSSLERPSRRDVDY